MHAANRRFWQRAKADYPRYFDNPEARVIEFGSYNINGTIRDYIAAKDYTGLDWRPGPCVDIVSLAHDAPFGAETFDLVVSASMLEHDPHWRGSLARMASVMKPDGMIALSWGAARNSEHCLAEAPDGAFHSLKAGLVLRELATLGVRVHFFAYERPEGYETRRLDEPGVMYFVGEVTLIGFKDIRQAHGRPWIDPVQEWDAAE